MTDRQSQMPDRVAAAHPAMMPAWATPEAGPGHCDAARRWSDATRHRPGGGLRRSGGDDAGPDLLVRDIGMPSHLREQSFQLVRRRYPRSLSHVSPAPIGEQPRDRCR